MKIMIVTPYFYPYVGGLENYAFNTAKSLRAQGHKVLVVSSNHENKNYVDEKVQGIRVIRLPISLKLSNTPIGFRWKSQIKQIIKLEKPDIINAHTPVPFMADMALRASGNIPVVLTYHNDLIKPQGLKKYLAKMFYLILINKTLRKSDTIVVTSEYYAKESSYLKKYQFKLEVIPPGVDTERFNRKVTKTWLKEKYPDRRIVLFVGNMNRSHSHKGVDILMKAIADTKKQVPNIHLVAVGKCDNIDAYRELADKMKIKENVTFTGFVTEKDLPKYYAGADVLVLPSTTEAEGFGTVIIEALACGTAVIGSNIGGIPAALNNSPLSMLADAGNALSLSKQIQHVLDKKPGEMRNLPKKFINSYDEIATKYSDAFQISLRPLIVQVIPHFPPYLGGMEQRVQELSEELNNNGYRTLILTSHQKTYPHTEIKNRQEIRYLRSIEVATTPIIPTLFFHILKLPRKSILHVHVALAFTPEVAFMASKLKKIPFIAHIRLDVQPSGPLGILLRPYKKYILGPVLRNANRIIVLSDGYKKVIIELYGVKKNRLVVIPNATTFPIVKVVSTHLHAPFRLLLVGRLSHQKNIPLLLNATKKLVNDNLPVITTIVGDGEDKEKLQELVKELGIKGNVIFKGRLNGPNLIEAYLKADIVVQTSFEEGFSTVLIEAMASGKPIIATAITGTKDVIKDGVTGLLVNPSDVHSLTSALKRLISSPLLRDRLVKQGLSEVESYMWPEVTKKTMNIYEDLSSGKILK